MTADDSYGTCAPVHVDDLREMLLGSGKIWRSTCKKPVAHSLVIQPTVKCRGDDWTVQYMTFKLKAVKRVEVYVDGEDLFSVSCSIFFNDIVVSEGGNRLITSCLQNENTMRRKLILNRIKMKICRSYLRS